MNWYTSVIDPGNAGGSVPIPETPTNAAKSITYECPRCASQFNTLRERQEHFFLEHPFRNPALLLHGRKLSQTGTTISEPTQNKDWLLSNCDYAKLNNRKILPEDLFLCLTREQQGFHILELSNTDATERFELHFCIPKIEEILFLEENFRLFFTKNQFTVTNINLFYEACTPLKTITPYLEGICQYLYGVLAKDQRGNTEISHEKYKERFNQALEALRYINRPIAHAIRAAINFSRNSFAQTARQNYAPNLSIAASFFESLAGNKKTPKIFPNYHDTQLNYLPIDYATDQILRWTQLSQIQTKEELGNVYYASKNNLWTAEDRIKAIVLWLYWANITQPTNEVRPMARSLLNDAIFAIYAENILENTTK